MLFRKNIEPHCVYCRQALPVDGDTMVCKKKGIVPLGGRCRKFQYDPLKRTPARQKLADFTKYDNRDFSL